MMNNGNETSNVFHFSGGDKVNASKEYQTATFFNQAGEVQSRNLTNQNYMIKEEKFVSSRTPRKLNSHNIKPLMLKFNEEIEPNRLVLYREDCRQLSPAKDSKKHSSGFYIVEISRSKRKFYIISVKIPKELLLTKMFESRKAYKTLTQQAGTKVYYTMMTEKQGKKLLFECNNDFKEVVDRVYVKGGKLVVEDFENLLKFGNPDRYRDIQPRALGD